MNLKQFLKPDWRKIVLTVILIFVLMIYFPSFWGLEGIKPIFTDDKHICCFCETATCEGIPFIYAFGGCVSEILCYDTTIYWDSLILDLIFWYLLSCFIVWIYNKVKKK